MTDGRQRLMLRTLAAALDHVDGEADPARFAEAGRGAAQREPHPGAPPVGEARTTTFTVRQENTAAAMGHPDPAMTVLGSPHIGLWFEIATNPLMLAPEGDTAHVGVGLVVHHLERADVGDQVDVTATVTDVDGRSVVFALEARAGDRVIATGTHHRIILDRGARP